jgi:divalent metal cation (Fe/Co/Zn/Cd) transporter
MSAHAGQEHGHSHGRIDPSIMRSRDGLRVVATAFTVLGVTAVIQVVIYATTGSVALLAI